LESEHPASQVPLIESWKPLAQPEQTVELEQVMQFAMPEQSITHFFVEALYLYPTKHESHEFKSEHI